MKPYLIILKNSNTSQFFHRKVFWAHTFPEAAREAYYIQRLKGSDWKITNVGLDTQWDMRHGNK